MGNKLLISVVFPTVPNARFPEVYSSANLVMMLISDVFDSRFMSAFCLQFPDQNASL